VALPYTQVIHGDSQLLMVGNQIDVLTLGLFFDHNLCCTYPNGSYEPILNIYFLKKIPMAYETLQSNEFWPLKSFFEDLKIPWDSNSQSGSPLGSVGADSLRFFPTLEKVNVTHRLHSQLSPFHALCLDHEPKVRVVTCSLWKMIFYLGARGYFDHVFTHLDDI